MQMDAAAQRKGSDSARTAMPAESIEPLWLCARHRPAQSWHESGRVQIWLAADEWGERVEAGQMAAAVKWLAEATGLHPLTDVADGGANEPASTGERRGQVDAVDAVEASRVIYAEADFIRAAGANPVRWTSAPGLQMSPEFALYFRVARLAREIVARQDVLAFAAPTDLRVDEIVEMCLLLSAGVEDGWNRWLSHHSAYAAAWLPAWTEERLRALWMVYANEADQIWDEGWTRACGWKQRDHARRRLDSWLWHCVDAYTREGLVDAGAATDESTHSPYRVLYRGEAELMTRWQTGLWAKVDRDRLFPADGWLLRRLLLQSFAGSGWRFDDLEDKSGRAYHHIEFEVVPPPPDHPAADWRLRYDVVHNAWPIRVPLAALWQNKERKLQVGRTVLLAPDAWILPALRRAGECCDAIAQSLREPGPAGCAIAPEDMVDFVTTGLPALRDAGFIVRTQDFDAEQVANVRIRVRVRRDHSSAAAGRHPGRRSAGWFDADQLIDFDWTLAVGDEEISGPEFKMMVEARTPYIRLGGSWKLVPMQEILARLKDLGGPGKATGAAQFSRAVLMGEETGETSPVQLEVDVADDAMEARRVIGFFLHADPPKPMPTPQGFHGTLRQYQQTGYAWLLHLRGLGCGACLADDMGLGKTIQVLAYLLYLKEQGQSSGTHLLICPTSLLQNWKAEVARFAPSLRLYVHHGAERNAPLEDGGDRLAAAMQTHDVVMTTYAIAVRDLDILGAIEWDAIIADEAQNIKNADTKQARAVQSLRARHRIALTGTPVENRLEELWSIFHFTNPGYLGSLSWFRKKLAGPSDVRPDSVYSRRLHRLVQPLLLRRTKSDPAIQVELPEKWEVREYASLSTEQAALYQSVVNRLFTDIDQSRSDLSRRGRILAALVRLKQICDHPCLVEGGRGDMQRSGKLGLLMELLEDVVDEGASALIFTQFRDMGELLCETIAAKYGWRPKFLHGGLTASARGKIVDDYQNGQDKSPVLVLSLKAGGVGLNLTRANYVFHYDRWWNPAVEDQATDRVFRIGQTKDVQVHKLICAGTLEERIDQLITSKRQLSAAVVGDSAEGWITELDDTALRELFALDADAAVEDFTADELTVGDEA